MEKEKSVSVEPSFFERPPLLFAAWFWSYPLTWNFAYSLLLARMRESGIEVSIKACIFGYVLWHFLPLLLLVVYSRWVRHRVIPMLALWFVLWAAVGGITQGAMSPAISKCFSAVTH